MKTKARIRSMSTLEAPFRQERSKSLKLWFIHNVAEIMHSVDWNRLFFFKTCAYAYIAFILWLVWRILPLTEHRNVKGQDDQLSPDVGPTYQTLNNYFDRFEGFSECGIRLDELYYAAPTRRESDVQHGLPRLTYCADRKTLLQALSEGGRIGFDSPYIPRDCAYHWFTIHELCFILQRFENVVFIGDAFLQTIYNGLNILLRQDLALGAFLSFEGDLETRQQCRCDNQFMKESCVKSLIQLSEQFNQKMSQATTFAQAGREYQHPCQHRMHHAFLGTNDLLTFNSEAFTSRFRDLVPSRLPKTNSYNKPVPIVYSVSPSRTTHEEAEALLLQLVQMTKHAAASAQRKVPILWIGPTAAGHVDVRGRKGNQEIWDFDRKMARAASENDIEVLGMWNLTVQASSWDGLRFGEKVAITQAMMVFNWLGKLESS